MSNNEPVVLTAELVESLFSDGDHEPGLAAMQAVRDGTVTCIPTAKLREQESENAQLRRIIDNMANRPSEPKLIALAEQYGKALERIESQESEIKRLNKRFGWMLGRRIKQGNERRKLESELARLKAACSKTNDEISQTLGRELGYPWFKDDQTNFPGATEANGVCVGEHVAETLAMEAARRITDLNDEIEILAGEIERLRARLEITSDHIAGYDGIAARDETIRQLEKRVAELESWATDVRDKVLTPVSYEPTELGRIAEGFGQQTARLLEKKVERAKLDNEAYQRGYADAIKHAELESGEPVGWMNRVGNVVTASHKSSMQRGNPLNEDYDRPLFLGPQRMTEAQALKHFEHAWDHFGIGERYHDTKAGWLAAARYFNVIPGAGA